MENTMGLSAKGEPVTVQDETKVDVGIHLQQGGLTLTQNGKDFEGYQASVEFVAAHGGPWTADKVKFSAKGPDGKSVGLTVDLLNDTFGGPRDGVPAAISAGDIGITYAIPDPRPM
ncbi:hypothetical protein [Streptomyces goshikiensis]|uniref:hypothetical protein n=1 Tax=Streptomyces goshikiensis TaxID=1942 RepID=UPI0036DC96E6